ncbi:MAG TPA: hypothetical protein VFW33_08775 [Gemmataceae bacterium]|nr:hypothetical protein [Gemmataceae bacterium]
MSLETVPPVSAPSSRGGEGPEPAPGRQPLLLGMTFAGLVCALAFLLASTPARNSDLWLHLASGRALARGEAARGTDPFASTTAGTFWVNRSWLGDLVLYTIYQLGDGRALVVARGVLVALVAALFFGFRRAGARWEVLAVPAALAVLALGPWLALQPALLSLPGVVLTLLLLERGGRGRWLLVPLFALWANLDGWFVLGPALVGLYVVGEGVRRLIPGGRDDPRAQIRRLAVNDKSGVAKQLVLLSLAGLAACLVNPYGYHVFAWPTPLGLSHTEQVLAHDPLGRGLVVSPFGGPWASAPAFASPGGWAYCLLLAGGLASFALRGRALSPGRLLAWLALAALSLYQARAIPFFAVAAGPVLALNLQEGTSYRPGVVARGLGLVAGFALLVAAWPGWLQPAPYRPRAWAVERDESLVRLAGRLQEWHAAGKLRPGYFALTFSPEVAHYLAWFGPSEKGFLDSRWPLFDAVADDFLRMRHGLLQPEGSGPDPDVGRLMDRYHVDRVILHDPDWDRTTRAYRCLLVGEGWELLSVEGTAALFGRNPGGAPSAPWQPYDWRRAAYDPDPDRRAPPAPPRPPEPPGTFDAFTRAREAGPGDRGEAALDLIYFDLKAPAARGRLEAQWVATRAAVLLASGAGAGPGGVATRLVMTPLPIDLPAAAPRPGPTPADEAFAVFLGGSDQGPREALLPAVRAARRALAANPDDAGAFLLLGEAYLRLSRQTREAGWQSALPDLIDLRRIQTLAALEQAVLLRPDLDEAHALLAQLYAEAGQNDRALAHLRARLDLADREAAGEGPRAREAADRRLAVRVAVEQTEAKVKTGEAVYAANADGLGGPSRVLERARLALRQGLAEKALQMLLDSSPVIFGRAGTQMQLDLMLQGGRAYEVREAIRPEHEALLDSEPYHRLRLQADAACGDYAGADGELETMAAALRRLPVSREETVGVREAIALRVGGAALARPGPGAGAAGLADVAYQQFGWVYQPSALRGAVMLLRREANLGALRALLALESGDVAAARDHFASALRVWGDESQVASGAGVDFLARPIVRRELRVLDGVNEER